MRYDAPDLVPELREGESEMAFLVRIAAKHLDVETAGRWLKLLRPAIGLTRAQEGDDVLATLGGRPLVPDWFEWPESYEHGAMTYVGELDLDAIAASGLETDASIPASGRLLAFCVRRVVRTKQRATRAGRLVHVTDPREICVPGKMPRGIRSFTPEQLTGRQLATWPMPGWLHPAMHREFAKPGDRIIDMMSLPMHTGPLSTALHRLRDRCGHQLGGWPSSSRVEIPPLEPAQHHLLQIASDDWADMRWGDDWGSVHWYQDIGTITPDHPLGMTSFCWLDA